VLFCPTTSDVKRALRGFDSKLRPACLRSPHRSLAFPAPTETRACADRH
jgi:hypothetical protein